MTALNLMTSTQQYVYVYISCLFVSLVIHKETNIYTYVKNRFGNAFSIWSEVFGVLVTWCSNLTHNPYSLKAGNNLCENYQLPLTESYLLHHWPTN